MLKNYLANKLAGNSAVLLVGGALVLGAVALVASGNKEPEKIEGLDGVKKKSTQQRKNKSATVTI